MSSEKHKYAYHFQYKKEKKKSLPLKTNKDFLYVITLFSVVYRSDVFPKVFFKYTHLKDKEHLFNFSLLLLSNQPITWQLL